MKKILITGANGLLGQKVVAALKGKKDWPVLATSKGPCRFKANENIRYEPLDITQCDQLQEVIEKHRPQVLLNTAAMTNVDECEKEKDLCWKINVEAVEGLMRQCQKREIHLIHLSTDFIFDGAAGPYKEEDPPSPQSHYAESKLESEKVVQSSRKAWTIIRTILLYGAVPNRSRTNIVLWAKESLEKGKKIRVVEDQYRMPTLAEDLAAGCIAAAQRGATGIYHVSGKDMMSILELVRTVADFFGLDKSFIEPTKTELLGQPATRPAKTGFILDKAKAVLGYEPHSFKEGLQIVKGQLSSSQK